MKNNDYDYVSKIHCVYVYEISSLKTCYVGRTLNLKSRDLAHRRGRRHSDGTITYDSLNKFCKENSIVIPTPIVKETNLNAEESLIREDYWLNEYKANGWNTLNIAKTGKNSGSLGSVSKWNYNTCKEFAKDYKYKVDLKKANYSCYYICLKNKWLEDFGLIDKREHPIGYWTFERCIEKAKECKNKTDFFKKYNSAYISVRKHNWNIDYIFQKKEIDEESIINSYKEGMTIDELKGKYKIGKYLATKILKKNNIEIRKNYGKNSVKREKGNNKEHKYIAVSKDGKFKSYDYKNLGGHLTKFLRENYNIKIPNLYFRKKYLKENGKEWLSNWFDIIETANLPIYLHSKKI